MKFGQVGETKEKSGFADIQAFYVGLGNINITNVLKYVPE